MTNQDADQVWDENRENPGNDQGDPTGLQAFHKVWTSGKAHHSDEAGKSDKFEDP